MDRPKFIEWLSTQVPKRQRISKPWQRFVVWALFSLTPLTGYLLYDGAFSGLSQRLQHLNFVTHLLLQLILAAGAAYGALLVAIPGRPISTWLTLTFVAFVGWIASLVLPFLSNPFDLSAALSSEGGQCSKAILLLSAFPAIPLFWLIRQAQPLNRLLAGLLASLSSSSLAAAATHIHCCSEAPLHLLLWHFLPVLGLGLAGAFFGRLFLRSV